MKIRLKHIVVIILSVFVCNIFIYVFNWMLKRMMGISHPFWLVLSFSVVMACIPVIFILAFYLIERNLDEVWFEIVVEKENPFKEEDD